MTILDGLFILISVIWISEFFIFRNRGTGKGDPLETRSFLYIFTSLFFTIAAALFLQEFREEDSLVLPMKTLGFLLFLTGVILRFWGITHLKAQFTRHVTVRDGDEIVSSGPYRRLRHPLYTGLLFIAVGMALYFTSLIAAVAGGLLTGFMLLKRIRYEEKLLVEKFGPDYEKWMSRRARLLPFIY
ncbi:isoprenylcysteine carboxylmethyltransferase family protein [Jeotgalibacillus sp. ET6]|uniref:methyltransferase family protein n=1 Tax=Jeotgalibacillus sp. ET6 TaxID=3037260 RepID=UPI002418972D|nr:isoprenylcysteine carboxylmethyltransferase family protein [Jeotgalibacillus sp. ET6]MDG5472918.1 isoprenylcysteine carboxylmethyltransferase family protein [Jeotgalibacillus sp. ET6]